MTLKTRTFLFTRLAFKHFKSINVHFVNIFMQLTELNIQLMFYESSTVQ